MAEKPKKPAVSTATTTSTVLSIVQKLASHFQRNIWAEDIKDYADYIVYNSKYDKEWREVPGWQTNGTIPIARMHNDVMFSSVYDNVLQSRVSGRTKEDHVKAETVRNYVEWGMSRGWSRKELIESAKEAIICWEGYGFIGFKNEKDNHRAVSVSRVRVALRYYVRPNSTELLQITLRNTKACRTHWWYQSEVWTVHKKYRRG